MFKRVSIPTPFQIGPVNAYLAGRTVVDPGPDSEEAWARLLDSLENRELQPGDLEQVLITHPHPDHFGLASRLREAGARVVASPEAADIMADFPGRFDYEQEFFEPFFERCGMDAATAGTVTELPGAFIEYAPSVDTDRTVTEADTIAVADTEITVEEVTGHSEGELLFTFDGEDGREAIVGDNVLPDITPNPFLQPPHESGGDRPRVLPAYNDSLDRLRDQDFGAFLPGHRERIESPSDRIAEIREEHEQRTEDVADLVDGPTSPVEVMQGLFGDLPATEQFPGMSEAVGHLDVLEARGRVTAHERGGLLLYEPV
jgi:glyoxylase-like metal-dependent hydrolase (beta-lactamase superfamily II)